MSASESKCNKALHYPSLHSADSYETENCSGTVLTLEQKIEIGVMRAKRLATIEALTKEYHVDKNTIVKVSKNYKKWVASAPLLLNMNTHWLELNQETIIRIVLYLTLCCAASYRQASRFCMVCLNVRISHETIRKIVRKYAAFAKKINETISLKGITDFAIDEIFQLCFPVLTGIDLKTGYVVNMVAAADRTAETWKKVLRQVIAQGLNPSNCVSDACGCILSVLQEMFPDAHIQLDVFHALMDLGQEVEKAFYWVLKKSCKKDDLYKKSLKCYRALKKLRDELSHARKPERVAALKKELGQKMEEYLSIQKEFKTVCRELSVQKSAAEELDILKGNIVKLLGFSGYTLEETEEQLVWILAQMKERAELCPNKKNTLAAIESFRKKMPKTLEYIRHLFSELDAAADQEEIDRKLVYRIYHLRSYRYHSRAYNQEWNNCFRSTGYNPEIMDKAEAIVKRIIPTIKRASSLVECLNSRIRPFMNVQRKVSAEFFDLLTLYINTYHLDRSRVPSRVGKCPMELLTGEEHVDFWELLGIAPLHVI